MNKRTLQKKYRKFFLNLALLFIVSAVLWIKEQVSYVDLPKAGEAAKLYANETSDDLRQTFCTAIAKAESSVLLIIYGLTDPYVIDALNKKSQQGVPVQVIHDAEASKNVKNRLENTIQITKRFGPGLMHIKILVIDEKQIWIGSANMTHASLRIYGNLVTAIVSPELAEHISRKAESLKSNGLASQLPPQIFSVGEQKLEMWFLPNRQAIDRVRRLIQSAQKTLRIAMYTWTREDFAREVIHAHNRGVDTQIVIDNSSSNGSSAKIVRLLKKEGVPVFLSRGAPLLHHKFSYIDKKILINGSANWTARAFDQNDDCFLIVHDLNEEQQAFMERLWKTIKSQSNK